MWLILMIQSIILKSSLNIKSINTFTCIIQYIYNSYNSICFPHKFCNSIFSFPTEIPIYFVYVAGADPEKKLTVDNLKF